MLHFAETWKPSAEPGKRRFGITVNGETVATAFDPIAAAGGFATPTLLRVPGVESVAGVIRIAFIPDVLTDSPMLNGIEILRR